VAARRSDVGMAQELLCENDVARNPVERVCGRVAQLVQAPFRREAGALEAALEPVMRG
jgi:hypothetical protein